jgi:type I restriction enzyme S subunit
MSKLEKYSSYKDSGVEWLGEIPEHWEVQRLGTLGVFSASGIDKYINKNEPIVKIINFTDIYSNRKRTLDNSIKFMEVTTPENNRKKHLVKKGDLIFLPSSETYEDLGLSALVDEELDNTSFSYHVIRLQFKKDIEHSFRKYLTNNNFVSNQFSSYGKGTTRKIIGRNVFNNIKIVLPPKEEQILISSFLDKKTAQIDEVISQKQKLIELLKERKQIVINDAVTKGLDKNVEFVDSGVEWIGKMPKHWEISKLGTSLKPISIKNRADLPLLSVTREQGVILRDVDDKESNHNFIPDDLSGYKMVEKGQFAMNKMKAWQGSYGISDYTGIVSPAYFIFELNGIEPTFFHKAIRSSVYVPFFIKASDGVRIGQWDLSKSRMKEIPFYIPPKNEQLQIVKHIDDQTTKIDKAIELQQNYIAKLKEYKASLIDSVVMGKVRVI